MQEKAVKLLKTRASPSALVYRKVEQAPLWAEDFELPVEGKLAADNRWVILAQLIPWAEFEQEYAQNFEAEAGPPAKSFRLALGALIIKEKLGISDRETVEQIRENPYLQYFIGQTSYSNEIPFDPSLLVHFRQRISGPPLGRPPAHVSPEKKKQALKDEKIRNSIEGKFGQGKRRLTLSRVMAKLPNTSQTAIAIAFLVMNLSTTLTRFFCVFLCLLAKTTVVFGLFIIKNYKTAHHRKQELILLSA